MKTLQDFKHSYKSKSIYFKSWDTLKRDLVIQIECNKKSIKRVKKAIQEIKYLDTAYAYFCVNYYGTKLKLEFTCIESNTLRITLHGTNQKGKPQIESTYI